MFGQIRKVKYILKSAFTAFFVSVPPSFHAIIAGAFISIAVNLLTGLILEQEISDRLCVHVEWSIAFLLISSGVFVWITIILEDLHSGVPSRKQLTSKVKDGLEILITLLIGGTLSFIVGIMMLTI